MQTVQTSMRLTSERICWPKQSVIGMFLYQQVCQFIKNGISFFLDEFLPTDFLTEGIPHFQHKKGWA